MKRAMVSLLVVMGLAIAAGVVLWSSTVVRSASQQGPAEPQTIDDVFAAMAGDNAGFAGMYLDPDQVTLHVLVKDSTPERAAAAERAARSFMEKNQDSREFKIEIGSARYDFAQLKGFYDSMSAGVWNVPGVLLTDIDEVNNRLRVGVSSGEAQVRVGQFLINVGIPREAFAIELTEPEVPVSSLRGYHRLLVGGLQLTRNGANPEICTLGFLAKRAGVEGFVTASHCSQVIASLDGTGFYQPTNSSGNLAGVETADPSTFTGGACPGGYVCRYSDSSFVSIAGGVSGSRGKIARPSLGSYAWNGSSVYRVLSSIPNAIVGDIVNKVGRTTGRTQGSVTGTCINGTYEGIMWLCRNSTNLTAQAGDSGSPVFRILPPPYPAYTIQLFGIVVSVVGSTTYYAPMNEIMRSSELGIMLACDPGFGLNC